jgi:cell division protein FtsX
VLDFNSGLGWVVAADLGARAIVFVEPTSAGGAPPTTRGEAERKFSSLPIELPRFYAKRNSIPGLPASASAASAGNKGAVALGQGVLKARVVWERASAQNIRGTIKGTEAGDKAGNTIVIGGYYDSMSVVPDLAPGAEAAANCAALLELARYFKANPPKSNLMFVANGAHHVALAGMRNFAADHFIDKSGKGEAAKKTEIDSYRGFVGIDLSSRTPTVGLFAKANFYNQMTVGSENILLNQFAAFAKNINGFAAEEAKKRNVREEEFYVDGVTGREGRTWRSYLPAPLALDSEIATMAQKPGVSFATANDARSLQDTPFDTPDRLNLPNVARQVATIQTLLGRALGTVEDLPESSGFSGIFGYAIGRAIYRNVGQGSSFLPSTAIPDEKRLEPDFRPMNARGQYQDWTAKQREQLEGAQAVAFVQDRSRDFKSYSGVRGAFIERAQFSKPGPGVEAVAQFVFIGPRVGDPKGGGTPDSEIEAYSIDKRGFVSFAPDMGSERQRFSPNFKAIVNKLDVKDAGRGEYNVNASVITFESRAAAMFDTLDQRYFDILRELVVLDGQTDANPVEFGFVRPAVAPGASDAEPVAIVFARPEARFKLIMQMGLLGKRLVLLQTEPEAGKNKGQVLSEGAGFSVQDGATANRVTNIAYRTARDLWILDQQRIRLLKKFGINNERVDTLHGSAGCAPGEKKGTFNCPTDSETRPNGGAILAAEQALEGSRYDEFYLQSRKAFGLESRAYPDVEATAQDVLKGIIFYLALLLPFSFFLERLLFGFPDIRKQIAGAGFVFLAVFLGIRFVHPAFELALTPFIILLAFVILALTVVVTSFLSSKFEQEIKRLKQGVHFADVGRLSALGAALGLGIANMRRRPMRTALTCVTLVLLTFTVLSFTSVSANISNFARPYGNSTPQYEGFMIRKPDWSGMQLAAVNSMRNEFSQRFGAVAPRAWYLSRDQGEALQLRVNNVDAPSKYFYAPALCGFTPDEVAIKSPIPKSVVKGNWFTGAPDEALLPVSMLIKPSALRAKRAQAARDRGEEGKEDTSEIKDDTPPLGLTMDTAVGSRIQVAGQEMRVIGVFDDDKFYAARDLDDEQFTPVDYQNEQNKQAASQNSLAGQKGEEVQVQRYQHMDANALLLIPYETALTLGGSTRSLAAGFQNSESGKAELNQLMNRAALGIFGSTRQPDGSLQAALYSSVETSGYEGFGALIIPIAIAALIIANTMLGSVFERTKEISIYSAVGLAPIHVAALFIAEAIVYAVLGSISGYLIAQLVAKVVTATNLLPGITLNYSSSSAVLATLIVMATVLLSTIYPAWAASKLSNPDTDRRWKVNEPVGDIWRFQFPFTVSGLQPLGVSQFLTDFFDSHTDTSVGRFYTDRVHFSALTLRESIDVLNAGITPEALAAANIITVPANGAANGGANGTAGQMQHAEHAPLTLGDMEVASQPAQGISATEESAPDPRKKRKKVKVEAVRENPLISLDSIPAKPETEVYRMSMRVWLAPFDMGVSQDTDIILLPAKEPGLYELQLRLVRQSGEIAAWKRVNRQFIGDLRKQLLVWRTVSREGQQEYILRGRAHVNGQPVPHEQPGASVGV